MKKFIVFLCAMLWFAMGLSTVALGAPVPGTWNEVTTGIAATLDPECDGGTIGDVTIGRDTSDDSSPGYGHYWYFNGLTRDTLDEGDIIPNGDGITGTRTVHTTRSGGTFFIRGDHLWDHDPDTIYTATIQNESSGTAYFARDNVLGPWYMTGYEGETHIWGYFNEDPYLIDFTDHASISYFGEYEDEGGCIIIADLTNVNMKIETIIYPTLVFFDESVEDGTLEGRGRGWLAKLRLCIMREMLVIAGEFIENEQTQYACFMLKRAYKRCDGESRPRDFVVGDAVPELAEMIQTLRTSLGCE